MRCENDLPLQIVLNLADEGANLETAPPLKKLVVNCVPGAISLDCWSRFCCQNQEVPLLCGELNQIQVFFRVKAFKLSRMGGGSRLKIAIEGCIGVGKTTLATKLAGFRKSVLVLEEFEKNPFLGEFYNDPAANVFETEMQFLLLHYHQLKGLPSFAGESIADFTFAKDLIFSDLNFQVEAEKKIFVHLYDFLLPRLSPPDLVIYLKGSDDLVIDRIRKRNRSIEQIIDVEYYRKLKRAYDKMFLRGASNVHVIDADHFDWINDPTALGKISSAIDSLTTQTAGK